MARPREFNTDVALEQAMQVFWAKGYEATSLQNLIHAMGISKSSFYETFGSKHELFMSAIEHYEDTVTKRLAGVLEGAAPARMAIAEVFDAIIKAAVAEGDRRGCLLCNSAVEVSPHDSEAAALVATGLARVENAFHRAVVRGQDAGEIPAERDARALARYLTSSANGLQVMAKASPNRAALENVAGIVLSVLD